MADLDLFCTVSDLFSLGGDFKPQRSSTTVDRQTVEVFDGDGSVACTTGDLDVTTSYECEYIYCGTALNTAIDTALLTNFGSVKDSKLVTEVTVSFKENEYPRISVRGHNHAVNAHASGATAPDTFNASGIITDTGGIGGWDIFSLANVGSCVESTDVSFVIEHNDRTCGGDHAAGQNLRAKCTATCTYVGDVSASVGGSWTLQSNSISDDNAEQICTESVTAFQNLTKN